MDANFGMFIENTRTRRRDIFRGKGWGKGGRGAANGASLKAIVYILSHGTERDEAFLSLQGPRRCRAPLDLFHLSPPRVVERCQQVALG